MSDRDRFHALRSRLFGMIKQALAEDPCCKNYEGCLEVLGEYPTYFDDNLAEQPPDFYRIRLHCYVIGPSRHYDFVGKTFTECLDKFEAFLAECEAEGGE